MQKRLVDLTKSDSLNDSDYLFINHDDNPIQVSLPYFKQNVAPVDATLTEEGKAADAKATGDKINEINTNIESINTEIEGVKTNYATKEELSEVSTNLTETQENVSELSTSIENVKANYLTKSDAQNVYLTKEDASTISDKEFYEGRKYDGMTYTGKTSDKGIKLHSVKGKTSQKTTNGYQLFDSSKLATKSQGGATVTNNGDGSFTVSGSGTLSERYVSDTPYTDIPFKLKAGKLFLLVEASTYPCCYIDFADENGVFVTTISLMNGGNTAELSLSSETVSKIKKYKPVFVGNVGGQIKTGTVKPMLYQDGDGTWEQYTGGKPAPNPDYAMEIENVEINEITSHGKNILPNYAKDKVMNGITYKVNPDKSIKITGTANGTTYIQLVGDINDYQTERFRVDDDYIVSGINSNDLILSARITNGNYINVYAKGASEYDIKGRSLGCVYIQVPNGKTVDVTVYPQIELGSVATDYQPYNVIETSLTLAQDDIYKQGTITRDRKQVTFDGSSDEAWNLNPTWSENSDYSYYYIKINDIKSNLHSFISNRFKCITDKIVAHPNEEAMFKDSISTTAIYVSILKSRLSSTGDFKEWLKSHSLKFEYELATPTTEEYQVPTIPSYYPYTNVSTDNDLTTDITWKILADCDNSLKQEELEKRILALETKAIE